MKLPVRIEVAPQGTSAERVEQEIMIVARESKKSLLETLLKKYLGTILLFSRTKHGAKKICFALRNAGHSAAEIHSNRSLAQRREALEGFKHGKYRILVATDIAARGIDVNGIEVVINYDLPDKLEDYVHRIGRTGRAGKEGRAISFATPQEQQDIRKLERLIQKSIPVSRPTGLPATTPYARVEEDRPYGHSGGGQYRNRNSSQGSTHGTSHGSSPKSAYGSPQGYRGAKNPYQSQKNRGGSGGWTKKPRLPKKW
jgi:ATP-dependent RNA helicase RhlE